MKESVAKDEIKMMHLPAEYHVMAKADSTLLSASSITAAHIAVRSRN